ncbi:MAPEG family protein [Labrys wisconsinensis]|uniref:MAPEG family protein n=1 Tax=Labrys wisconsinensis TaxID=425677 RepID=A0ABU0J2E7_9HYPH|nr:MAPEG family protein [Labrys wisconsinensis]MDQ0468431.1 hypothetical protein [Labrys wisconsinensis]
MSVQAVLLPVFAQVALTFALLIRLGLMRTGLVRSGAVKVRDIVLGQKAWPERATQTGNCFDNQFQIPVLFYVLTALALITRKADLLFVVLAWVFVMTRLVHAGIHTGSNRLSQRFYAYAAGVAVLLLMWVIFALDILTTAVTP